MRNAVRKAANFISSPTWNPIFQSAGMGTLNRISNIAARVFAIPLVINYLGDERFGLVMTVSSISSYIFLLDFGVASALVNKLTASYTAGEKEIANRYITAGLAFLVSVSILIGLCLIIGIPAFDWESILKLKSVGRDEADVLLFVALGVFLIQLPLSLVQKVPYAFQRGRLNETYLLIANLFCLAGLALSIVLKLSISFITFFLVSPPTIGGIALLIHLLMSEDIKLVRLPLHSIVSLVRESRKAGYDFIVMQALSVLMTGLQFTMLALYHGAAAVAPYALMFQVLVAVQTPFVMLIQPMWTKVSQLMSQNDLGAIRNILRLYFKIAFVYSLVTACFFIFMINPLLAIFLRDHLPLPFELRLGFAILAMLGLLFGGGIGSVILGMNLTRQMAKITFGQFAFFLIVGLLLISPFGSLGVVMSTCAGYLIAVPGSLLVLKRNLYSEIKTQ